MNKCINKYINEIELATNIPIVLCNIINEYAKYKFHLISDYENWNMLKSTLQKANVTKFETNNDVNLSKHDIKWHLNYIKKVYYVLEYYNGGDEYITIVVKLNINVYLYIYYSRITDGTGDADFKDMETYATISFVKLLNYIEMQNKDILIFMF